jgi:archaellum component FlaG (FlaF/FlaG flagellin family)
MASSESSPEKNRHSLWDLIAFVAAVAIAAEVAGNILDN